MNILKETSASLVISSTFTADTAKPHITKHQHLPQMTVNLVDTKLSFKKRRPR